MVDFGGWELPVQFTRHPRRARGGAHAASGSSTSRTWARSRSKAPRRSRCCSGRPATTSRSSRTAARSTTACSTRPAASSTTSSIYRNAADDYFVVVNASNSDKDFEWIAEVREGDGRRGRERQRRLRAARAAGAERRSAAAADDRRRPRRRSSTTASRTATVDGVAGDRLAHRLHRRGRLRDLRRPRRRAAHHAEARSTPARSRAASARATRCASRRRWRSTATTSTTPPRRSRPTSAGS